MLKSRIVVMVLVGASLAAGGCKKKPVVAPAPVVNQDSINAENARRAEQARLEQMRRDSLAREQSRADSIRAAREGTNRAVADARATITNPVMFEFDKSDLTADDVARLDAKIPLLNVNPDLRIRVAGHTDSRGSDEYNMALGQRRAASAKRYLTQHGISTGRIETVSFGEERPVATGDDENSMAQNRRAEFEIIAGGENIRVVAGG